MYHVNVLLTWWHKTVKWKISVGSISILWKRFPPPVVNNVCGFEIFTFSEDELTGTELLWNRCVSGEVLDLIQRNTLTGSRQLYVTMRKRRIVPEFDGFPHNEALSLIWKRWGFRGRWVPWWFHTSALRNVWRKEGKHAWLIVHPKIKETNYILHY